MTTGSRTVGVRLDERQRALLEAHAKRLKVPPSSLARRLLAAALEDDGTRELRETTEGIAKDLASVREELDTARKDVAALRKSLWNATLALLVRGQPFTAAQANQWVRENLTR